MPPPTALRLIALGLTNALGIIAGSVGLNALIKSNQQQSRLRHLAPKGTTVIININDVFHTGVISTTVSALIGLLAFLFISIHFISPRHVTTQNLKVQGGILAFLATWLLSVQTAYTVFFATRQAQVTAFNGGKEVSQIVIKAFEKQVGATRIYKDIDFLRLVAVIPWFTLLLTAISATILLMSGPEPSSTPSTKVALKEAGSDDEKTPNGV